MNALLHYRERERESNNFHNFTYRLYYFRSKKKVIQIIKKARFKKFMDFCFFIKREKVFKKRSKKSSKNVLIRKMIEFKTNKRIHYYSICGN